MSKYETKVKCTAADLLGGDRVQLPAGNVWRVVNTPVVDDNDPSVLRFQLDNGSISGPVETWAFYNDSFTKIVYDDDALLDDLEL